MIYSAGAVAMPPQCISVLAMTHFNTAALSAFLSRRRKRLISARIDMRTNDN